MSGRSDEDHVAPKPLDYEVGYAKPPTATRFQPGRSGNPSGRRKGTVNHQTALQQALAEQVVVTIDGKKRKLSKLQLAFQQLANKAAKGDFKATAIVLSELGKLFAAQPPDGQGKGGSGAGDGTSEDADVFANVLKRVKERSS